jgi:hypothetical protein
MSNTNTVSVPRAVGVIAKWYVSSGPMLRHVFGFTVAGKLKLCYYLHDACPQSVVKKLYRKLKETFGPIFFLE